MAGYTLEKLIERTIPIPEIAYLPLLVVSALVLKMYRRVGARRMRRSTRILKKIGVFPIINHYYDPLVSDRSITTDLSSPRVLPGIDFNIDAQIQLLRKMTYQDEFDVFLDSEKRKGGKSSFNFSGDFLSGDAEFLFNFVRHTKPTRVIEVGCGCSTKIIRHALQLNRDESNVAGDHICIEPFEQTWLNEFTGIDLIRQKIEDVDLSLFEKLDEGNLLFIDSSHVIRPQGDVVREYLTIVPALKKGVYVHAHDIFTPHDYLSRWVRDEVKLWNEQYLVEALLSNNSSFEVVAALNLLKHQHYDELSSVCNHLTSEREPGSFYFKKT